MSEENKETACAGAENHWAAAAAVGDAHKKMLAQVGDWNYDVEFCMSPGGDTVKSSGKASFKAILGGRFIEGRFQGNPSQWSPEGFQGVDILGYDNGRQHYTGYWLDSSSTQPMLSTGQMNGNVLEMSGVHDDPMSGVKDRPFRTTTTYEAEKVVMKMFQNHSDGTEFVIMTVTHTRAGA